MGCRRYKLVKGDCLEWMPKIREKYVDCIITDPPYGMKYNPTKGMYDTRGEESVRIREKQYFKPIAGDEFIIDFFPLAFRCLKVGGSIYVFCRWSKWAEVYVLASNAGFKVKNMIVLNKSNHGMGDARGSYAPKHELILFAAKGRHLFKSNNRPKDIWDVNVWHSKRYRPHPNAKPPEWITPAIDTSTLEGDIILDPFCGSGQFGLACLRSNRRYIGIEIDEDHYNEADRLLARYVEETPEGMKEDFWCGEYRGRCT